LIDEAPVFSHKIVKAMVSGLALLLAIPVSAQLYTASLTGTVLDPSGAPVADARVAVEDADRMVTSVSWTDQTGRYLFRSLAPGRFSVRIAATGFESTQIQNIDVEVSGSISADAKLALPVRRENVVVEVESPVTRDEDATLGLTLGRRAINDLPLV